MLLYFVKFSVNPSHVDFYFFLSLVCVVVGSTRLEIYA